MITNSVFDFLRQVPMFSDLADADLSDLVSECSVVELESGAVLFEEGAIGDAAYVVRQGKIEILKRSGARNVLLGTLNPGDLFGEMALLDDSPRMAGARAKGQTTVVTIGKAEVQSLLKECQSVKDAMFDLVLGRLKSTEAQLRQSERMVQLGTLSAGIAHELNNPASAAKRSSSQLAAAIQSFANAYGEFAASNPERSTVTLAAELMDQARSHAINPVDIDPFERSDAESECEDWLDSNGVENVWDIACDVVTAGYARSDLEAWATAYRPEISVQLARLIASTVSVATLIDTVEEASGRISGIVDALKSYSFLDQAPVQRVSVPAGIDRTLSLLRSRLNPGIEVDCDFDPGVPEIDARGSELNQVWTNLINNAVDAMAGSGDLAITAQRSPENGVTVTFNDSGHGIPAEILDRVFDAFFTTREPGQGTGLGLHTCYDIVVNKHHGNIVIESEPGNTTVTVSLPASVSSD